MPRAAWTAPRRVPKALRRALELDAGGAGHVSAQPHSNAHLQSSRISRGRRQLTHEIRAGAPGIPPVRRRLRLSADRRRPFDVASGHVRGMIGIWDVFVWRPAAERARPAGDVLVVCRACGVEAVVPVDWEDEGSGWCEIALRCGACGDRRDVTLDYDKAHEFDCDLDRGMNRIALIASELEWQRMLADIETLSVALERDLIGADDFSPGPPP
jgi:hypothetical protein